MTVTYNVDGAPVDGIKWYELKSEIAVAQSASGLDHVSVSASIE